MRILLSVLLFLTISSAFADSFTVTNANQLIEAALVKAKAASFLKVHINNLNETQEITNSSDIINAEIDNLNFDKNQKTWQANLLLKEGDRNLAPIIISGRYEELSEIPVLKRPIKSNEIISEEDIEISKQPANHLQKNTITDIRELIGKSPKRIISQNRPIRQDEISKPAIINKNARVTIIYKSRNLEIRTVGEAMDNGAKGDVIRVKNITSKAVISATVESGEVVRVSSPDTLAEAM